MSQISEVIVRHLISLIDKNAFQLYTEIEVSDKEPSVSFQGDQLNENGDFINYHTYRNTIDLSNMILKWNEESKNNGDRWNKAKVTVSKNGLIKVESYFDREFQLELYGNDD